MSRAKKRLSDGTEKKLRNLKPFKPGQSRESERTAEDARNRLGTQFSKPWKQISIGSAFRPSL